MILDPKGIATRVGDMHSDEVGGREERNNRGDASNRFMRFLIFSSGDGAPKAVPLSLVVRLEEISGKDLETSNGMQVIQYRNKLMPIMSIDGFVDLQEDDVRPVLVFSQNDEYVGILVQEILDIVEENLDIKMHNGQAGSFGSIVINERTTELVDVDHFIHQIYPDWSSMLEKNESSAQQKQKALGTLCYIDSCRLYRNLFSPLIEMRNLKVHEYASVELAFSEQEDNPFDYTAVIIAKDAYGKKSKEEFFDNFESVFGNIPCFLLGNSFSAEEEDFYLGRGCIACLGKGDREANMVTITDYIMQLGSLVA